jgi:hypothetical protein
LSQLDYVLGKRGGSDLPSHCGGRSGSLMLGRACHAQCYTGLSFLCPVLFFGYGCKDGLVEYLLTGFEYRYSQPSNRVLTLSTPGTKFIF